MDKLNSELEGKLEIPVVLYADFHKLDYSPKGEYKDASTKRGYRADDNRRRYTTIMKFLQGGEVQQKPLEAACSRAWSGCGVTWGCGGR